MHSAETDFLTQDDIDGIQALKLNRWGMDNSSDASFGVWIQGAGIVTRQLESPVIAKTFRFSFKPGCNGPWTSQLLLNGGALSANSENGNDNVGPWKFRLQTEARITSVGADLTTGECAYFVEGLK